MENVQAFVLPYWELFIAWLAERNYSALAWALVLNVISAIFVLIIGRMIARKVTRTTRKALIARKFDETLVGFSTNIVHAVLMVFVFISAFNKLGFRTTSFIAVLGAAGLAIGLALQGSLSSFAAGVMIIVFRYFKVGDFVEIGGVTGTVEEIHILATQLKTIDNKRVFIPNANITSDTIINYSSNPIRRIDMVFGIAYDADLREAKRILLEILDEDERILKDPAPIVAVSELADSSVNFVVRPWVNRQDYLAVMWAVHEEVKLRFDEAGIGIPFPQMDIHLEKAS